MYKKLKVRFDSPSHGWIGISLESEDKKLELSISYTPIHFPEELVESLLKTLDHENSVARGLHNPEQYNFVFNVEDEICRLTVQLLPAFSKSQIYGEEIFSYKTTINEMCLTFWRAIRELQGRVSAEGYNQGFHRDFPEREFEFLTEKIKGKSLQIKK